MKEFWNDRYAAIHGWDVYACDLSINGKEKAGKLAQENGVHINYDLGDFGALSYKDLFFDTIALIYAHFPTDKKADYKISRSLFESWRHHYFRRLF